MTVAAPPRWDLRGFFPSLDSPQFEEAFAGVKTGIEELRQRFDSLGVRQCGPAAAPADFKLLLKDLNSLFDQVQTVTAYIHSFIATNSRDQTAQARSSELRIASVELSRLDKRFGAWLGSIDLERLLEDSEAAREHAYPLRRAAESARRQMSELEEDLYAGLQPTGGMAWARLHGQLTSQMLVSIPSAGKGSSQVPMSVARSLAHDPDPVRRRTAYEAELETWRTWSEPLAAALNGIKGESGVVNQRRGWEDSLAPALFSNAVDRETLSSLQAAVEESLPDFRRYLSAKARLLGLAALPWWDLFAPLPGPPPRPWDYRKASEFALNQFQGYSERMGALARRAFGENWVDAEPRDGKRDGAFCMLVRGDQSRVMMNFTGGFADVETLAHELGHAYHNVNLAGRTALQRQTPMALAETASIFCQTLVIEAALGAAPESERLAILERDLQGSTQLVVDIHSRFLFERSVFEARSARELAVAEICELMLEAQRRTYGDGLDQQALHSYMWAVKTHYYGSSYYNWPYTFGFLFGLGLFARYRRQPDGFRAGYDELLASTGLANAAELAARFDIDVRSIDFWRSSLDLVRDRIDRFVQLAG